MSSNAYVYDQPAPAATPIPGVEHATWAGAQEGLSSLSLWHQNLAPGGCTPPHFHTCEEIVMCVAGRGEVHIGGKVHSFGAHQTVVLPANEVHQLFNVGTDTLVTTAVFPTTPVPVALPDGTALELPWRT